MAFKPDYGMALLGRGYRPGLGMTWMELEAFNIDAVAPGTYCTTLEMENRLAEGQLCCMTVDMGGEQLMALLRAAGPGVARDVASRLNDGERSINLEKSIRFMLQGELGEPRRGLHETFAPIIAKKIGPSPPRRFR